MRLSPVFGIPIEPEKEIILTVVEMEQTDTILSAIESAAELDTPGMGIAFVISLEKIARQGSHDTWVF